MSLFAKDVMTSGVVTIDHNATVEQAARTLVEHRMSGAPVVANGAELVGIISEYQLLGLIYDSKLKSVSVREVMTKGVISADVNDSLEQLADLFICQRIRRVPVTENGELAGIITRGDLLKWCVQETAEACS